MGNGITSSRTASSPVALSGSFTINALLDDTRWGTGNGATVSLPYSFLSSSSYYATNYSTSQEYNHSQYLTMGQAAAVRTALAAWSRVANLSFTEVADSSSQAGDLRFGTYTELPEENGAWGYYPGPSAVSGDVWFNDTTQSSSTAPGGFFIALAIHEIGHALGLKHPFEGGSLTSTTLPTALDNDDWTVMSYTHVNSIYTVTPLALDINAIQYLYGANTTATAGNDAYQLGAADQAIWDYSGTDSLVAASSALTYYLDLRAGSASTGTGSAGTARYYTMSGVTIENATGGAGNDALIGNDANNILTGGAGSDTIDGGGGIDTAVFDGAYASYRVTSSGATTIVRDLRASGGTDTLANVERLAFADQTIGSSNLPSVSTSVAGSTIYRFYNGLNGAHFFTASSTERDSVLASLPQYTYEGAAFSAIDASETSSAMVYRFYNRVNSTHFYTISTEERDSVIANLAAVYSYEGGAYQAYAAGSSGASQSGVTPLYRFYNTSLGSHFFTTSSTERDNVIATLATTYQYEGIAYYVASSASASAAAMPALADASDSALPGVATPFQSDAAQSAGTPWMADASATLSGGGLSAPLSAPYGGRLSGGASAGAMGGLWVAANSGFA